MHCLNFYSIKIKVRCQTSPAASAALNTTPSVYNHSIADNSEVSEHNEQNQQCQDGNGYDNSASLPNDVSMQINSDLSGC